MGESEFQRDSASGEDMTGDDTLWQCPWCGEIARDVRQRVSVCRHCACGAVGLAAPAHDMDEVIDDAINIFGIHRDYLTEYDSERLEGMGKKGVEMRPGEVIPAGPGHCYDMPITWFRRRPGWESKT